MMRNRRMLPALTALVAAVGCQDSEFSQPLDDALFSAEPQVVFTGDALYMVSPYEDQVIRVRPGAMDEGAASYTELESARIETIAVGPGPGPLLLSRTGDAILTLTHGDGVHGLAVLDVSATCSGDWPVDTGCVTVLEANGLHDTLVLSPDGRFAVSYLSDEGVHTTTEDVVNLNEIGVYDLDELTARFVNVGVSPKGFAFTHGDTNPRMVVLMSGKVVVVNLETGETTARDLTLSSDSSITPADVVVTGDDHYALVTIVGSQDLFTFDLTQPTLPINILNLSQAPRLMVATSTGEEAVVIGADRHTIDVIHQDGLVMDTYATEGTARNIVTLPGSHSVVTYDSSGTGNYLYELDTRSGRMNSYRLDNPCTQVLASPDGRALVLFYKPEPWTGSSSGSGLDSNYAVAILNLGQGDTQPTPIIVSSEPMDAVFYLGADPSQDQVFVPFGTEERGVVGRFNLSTYDSGATQVAPRPVEVGILSNGLVATVHQAAFGFISVFSLEDPDHVQYIRGFLTEGLL